MQVTKPKTQNSWKTILVLLAVFVWDLSNADASIAGYADSAHGDSSSGVKRSGVECPTGTPCPEGDCTHCHDTFDPNICGVNETMLFNTAADPDFCFLCHTDTGSLQVGGMPDASQVSTIFQQKTYKHNVTAYSGLHEFWHASPPADPGDQVEDRAYLSANKHVVCEDCHSPHGATAALHSTNEAHVVASSNLISDCPLVGALGVEPTWSSTNWGGVTAWPTTTSLVTMEYQICFKCHSDYVPWNDGGTGPASWTDVALEFNPSNESYHPVVQALPETDPGSNGSNRLPPSHISLLIGDSGAARATSNCTEIFDWQGTEPLKSWAPDQWKDWGLRIGRHPSGAPSGGYNFNAIRRIVSNYQGTGPYGWPRMFLQLDAPLELGSYCGSGAIMYSIEYYAGKGTRSGYTVTDTYKDFNLYLPSLIGYVVVISDEYGNNVAKGTVTSNDATSFTVGSWAAMYGGVPAGTVGYYFSATGQTMMCSDCHSNDTISSTAAQGPHGSAVKWMLKGRNTAWPTWRTSDNATGNGDGTAYQRLYQVQIMDYYDGRDGPNGDGLFCLNCHSTVSFTKDANGRDVWGNIHLWPAQHQWNACIRCHVMVPHGYRVSRLIGDRSASMPARYAFDNDWHNMYISTFTKHTVPVVTPIDPAGYGYSDCSTGSGNCHVF